MLSELVSKHGLGATYEDLFQSRNIVFGDFMRMGVEREERRCACTAPLVLNSYVPAFGSRLYSLFWLPSLLPSLLVPGGDVRGPVPEQEHRVW